MAILTSVFILFVICVLVFAGVYGVTWASFRLFAPHKKFDKPKALIFAVVVSVIISLIIIATLAMGFSNLPNQH